MKPQLNSSPTFSSFNLYQNSSTLPNQIVQDQLSFDSNSSSLSSSSVKKSSLKKNKLSNTVAFRKLNKIFQAKKQRFYTEFLQIIGKSKNLRTQQTLTRHLTKSRSRTETEKIIGTSSLYLGTARNRQEKKIQDFKNIPLTSSLILDGGVLHKSTQNFGQQPFQKKSILQDIEQPRGSFDNKSNYSARSFFQAESFENQKLKQSLDLNDSDIKDIKDLTEKSASVVRSSILVKEQVQEQVIQRRTRREITRESRRSSKSTRPKQPVRKGLVNLNNIVYVKTKQYKVCFMNNITSIVERKSQFIRTVVQLDRWLVSRYMAAGLQSVSYRSSLSSKILFSVKTLQQKLNKLLKGSQYIHLKQGFSSIKAKLIAKRRLLEQLAEFVSRLQRIHDYKGYRAKKSFMNYLCRNLQRLKRLQVPLQMLCNLSNRKLRFQKVVGFTTIQNICKIRGFIYQYFLQNQYHILFCKHKQVLKDALLGIKNHLDIKQKKVAALPRFDISKPFLRQMQLGLNFIRYSLQSRSSKQKFFPLIAMVCQKLKSRILLQTLKDLSSYRKKYSCYKKYVQEFVRLYLKLQLSKKNTGLRPLCNNLKSYKKKSGCLKIQQIIDQHNQSLCKQSFVLQRQYANSVSKVDKMVFIISKTNDLSNLQNFNMMSQQFGLIKQINQRIKKAYVNGSPILQSLLKKLIFQRKKQILDICKHIHSEYKKRLAEITQSLAISQHAINKSQTRHKHYSFNRLKANYNFQLTKRDTLNQFILRLHQLSISKNRQFCQYILSTLTSIMKRKIKQQTFIQLSKLICLKLQRALTSNLNSAFHVIHQTQPFTVGQTLTPYFVGINQPNLDCISIITLSTDLELSIPELQIRIPQSKLHSTTKAYHELQTLEQPATIQQKIIIKEVQVERKVEIKVPVHIISPPPPPQIITKHIIVQSPQPPPQIQSYTRILPVTLTAPNFHKKNSCIVQQPKLNIQPIQVRQIPPQPKIKFQKQQIRNSKPIIRIRQQEKPKIQSCSVCPPCQPNYANHSFRFQNNREINYSNSSNIIFRPSTAQSCNTVFRPMTAQSSYYGERDIRATEVETYRPATVQSDNIVYPSFRPIQSSYIQNRDLAFSSDSQNTLFQAQAENSLLKNSIVIGVRRSEKKSSASWKGDGIRPRLFDEEEKSMIMSKVLTQHNQ